MDKYFLSGKAECYECLYQPVCGLWDASGLSFRLVDGHFDSDGMAAGICHLIHSLTVPSRSNKHSLKDFGESASLGVILNTDDGDLLSAKRRKSMYERASLNRGKLSIGLLSLGCAGLPFGLFQLFFQRLDFRRMKCMCHIHFLLPLFSTSAFGDASQSIRSPAIDERKNLA